MFTATCQGFESPSLRQQRCIIYAYKIKKKVNFSSRNWIHRQLTDIYVKNARKDGYRSRAAYKILQIQEKFKIFKPGTKVIDLGAAPGGWSQVISKIVCSTDKNPCVLALDLLTIDDISGVMSLKGDFLDEQIQQEIVSKFALKADVIVSDMAPNTTGERITDHIRIMSLCEQAFFFAKENLNPGGSFVAKIFRGGTEHTLLKDIKSHFKIVKHYKPDSSRQESSEMYLIATGFKAQPQPMV